MPPHLLALIVAFAPPAEVDDVVIPPQYELGVSYYCELDRDCASFPNRPYCDPDRMECKECVEDEHCVDGWVCFFGSCADACMTDEDCDGVDGKDVCNPELGRCVDCLVDDQCESGLCVNTECIDCLEDTDCEAGQYCSVDRCVDQICAPDQLLCYIGDLGQCDSRGANVEIVEDCDAECVETVDGPMCPGQSTSSGGDTGSSEGTPPSPDSGDSTPAGSTSGGTAGGSPEQGDDGSLTRDGCACRATRSATPWWLALALPIFVRRRRR